MTSAMLPTSEWFAKWYHLHKWKFFYRQIELTCRFSKTLKGILYLKGLSTSEVQKTCSAAWPIEALQDVVFHRLGGEREWDSELLHLFGSPSRTSMSCTVFQTARTSSFLCTFLTGFPLVSYPQWGQLKDPGSGLHYHWIASALQGSDLGFLVLSGEACCTRSWPAEKEPDTLAQCLKWFLWTCFCAPCHPKE